MYQAPKIAKKERGSKRKEKREGKNQKGNLFFLYFFGYTLWPKIKLNGFAPRILNLNFREIFSSFNFESIFPRIREN